MTDWPLPSLRDLPASDEERYQALISYASAADWMYTLHNTLQKQAFESRGVSAVASLTSEQREQLIAQLSREETDASFTLFHFWLAATHVVVEGWDRLALADSEIDALLAVNEHRTILRRVRNATFHYQKTLREGQVTDFYQAIYEVGPWVQQLHNAFGRFFSDNPTRPPALPSPGTSRSKSEDLGADARSGLFGAAERLYDVMNSFDSTPEDIRSAVERCQIAWALFESYNRASGHPE